jgi:hypothetical protein
VLAFQVTDATGGITALFYGRTHIPGAEPGSMVQLSGRVGAQGGGTVRISTAYELVT